MAGTMRIRPKRMNLVAFQLGMLLARGQHNHPSRRIDFPGQLIALLARIAEELLQHGDHVIIGVIIIVQQDDIVRGLASGLLFRPWFGFRKRNGFGHDVGYSHGQVPVGWNERLIQVLLSANAAHSHQGNVVEGLTTGRMRVDGLGQSLDELDR